MTSSRFDNNTEFWMLATGSPARSAVGHRSVEDSVTPHAQAGIDHFSGLHNGT
jgi:hypothetical protein